MVTIVKNDAALTLFPNLFNAMCNVRPEENIVRHEYALMSLLGTLSACTLVKSSVCILYFIVKRFW